MHSPFSHYVNLPNPTPNLASWRNLTQPPPKIVVTPPPSTPPKLTRETCPVRHCERCSKAIVFAEKMSVRQYQARMFCSTRCCRLTRRTKLHPKHIKRIYHLRQGGFTHKEIAKRMKLALSTVSRVLRGEGLYLDMAAELGLQPEKHSSIQLPSISQPEAAPCSISSY